MAMSGEHQKRQFPPAPARWRRQGSAPDVNWIIASRAVPFLLGLAMIPIGFGVITSCTDVATNHDCGGYNTRITVGIIVQFLLFVIAMATSLRSIRTTWLTKAIVFASIATCVGVLASGA